MLPKRQHNATTHTTRHKPRQKRSKIMLSVKSIDLLLLLLLLGVATCHIEASRLQRDVSHLPLEYLPPVVLPPLPSREYLPPVEQHAASLPHVLLPPRDYLPPLVEQLKLSTEYGPPAAQLLEQQTEAAPSTSTSNTEAITEPPSTTEAATTPLPATESESEYEFETESPLALETHEHIVEPAGSLHADGYHYGTPEIVPDLTPAAAAYLPPALDDNLVLEQAAPQNDESAALLDDGYHYRAIRRLRF